LEISSHGIALFVVWLILATFVGGAVRTLLASDRVHQRIVFELRNRFPKHDIQIGTSEVLLSRGIWPGLGLKISGVKFTQEICGRLGFVIEVPTAIMPVDILSLRSGRLRLGDVELLNGKMHLDYRQCEEKEKLSAAAASALVPPVEADKIADWKAPRLDWKEWGRALDGVVLQNFAVTYQGQPDWKLNVPHAELDFSREFEGHATVEVQKSLSFGTLSHAVELEASSDNAVLQWQIGSEFKEGRLTWKGSWDPGTHAAASSFEVSQFPLREVFTELFQMGIIEQELDLKTTWINCSANWEGTFDRPEETPLNVGHCKIEGAYGAVQIEGAKVFPLQKELLKEPVLARVTNLQIQPVADALDRKVLPTVINKLGVWTGQVSYLSRDSWNLDGTLSGSEIVFSNQSVRGKQMFRAVHTQAEKARGIVSIKIDKVEMPDGEFNGVVEFNLNEDLRSGTFRTEIENIKFASSIQNLLINGQWEKVKLVGKGTLQNGELSDWRGTLDSPKVSGDGWVAEGLSVKSKYAPGVFTLDGLLSRLEIANQWKYFPPIQERVFPGAVRLAFKDVRSKMEVRSGGGEIQTWSAMDEISQKVWRGRGGWQRDRDLVAVVSGTVAGKPKNFVIRAEKGLLMMDEQTAAAR
jgi:hypothetical protein